MRSTTTARPRDWTRPVVGGLAGLLVALILVQAALAGQFLFGDGGIDVHGYLGNGSFAVGLAIAVAAVVGRARRPVMVLALALVAALFSQIGLGYAGRSSTVAASWHIPTGVASLGLATALVTAVALSPSRDAPG